MGAKNANGEQYDANYYNQATYEMQNDIDFAGVTHTPIGPNTGNKYNGTFDGQGHRIMNMIINMPDRDNVGFFGFLRGNAENTTIKNLIIDKS